MPTGNNNLASALLLTAQSQLSVAIKQRGLERTTSWFEHEALEELENVGT